MQDDGAFDSFQITETAPFSFAIAQKQWNGTLHDTDRLQENSDSPNCTHVPTVLCMCQALSPPISNTPGNEANAMCVCTYMYSTME